MIANNYSYETIVKGPKYDNIDEVEYKDIIWTEDAGTPQERVEKVRFVQNKKGILPIMLEKLWTERKSIKKEMKKVKAQLKEAKTNEEKTALGMQYDVLDGFQLAMKVSMNSIYGFTGANLGRLPEKRIAAATTAEGRRMIQACKEYVESNYDCKVVYGDSVAGYTPIYLFDNGDIKVIKIEELENFIKENGTIKKWIYCFNSGKEYIELSDLKLYTWTEKGWTHLKRVIRHKLDESKKMIRVITQGGMVDVTDDHSLLLDNCKEISPKNIKKGDKLLLHGKYKKSKKIVNDHSLENFNYVGTDQLILAKTFLTLQKENYELYFYYDKYKKECKVKNKKDKLYENNEINEIIDIEELEKTKEYEYVYDLTTENHHFAAGIGNIIVHNTDSIYVKFFTEFTGQEHMNEVFRISEIAADGCSQLFKKPIEMEFEKVMWPFILFSKKRYACVIWTNEHKHDYIDYKGIQVVRRDNCPYVKDKSMKIFEKILLDRDIPKSIEMGREYSQNLLDGKVSMKDLVISKSLKGYGSYEFDKQLVCKECDKRWYKEVDGKKKYSIQYYDEYNSNKELEYNLNKFMEKKHYCFTCKEETEYKTNKANIPHVALARKMKERDPYNCPQVGERVPYVFKKITNPRALQFERVEDPQYLVQNCIPIDFEYYFEHQFRSAIETIFYPILKEELEEKMFKNIIPEKPAKRIRKVKN